MFCFSYQDINLKVAKSSQALHFQFREDKQWKLQQVLYVMLVQNNGDKTGRNSLA